jgi:hypothetical protein
MVGTRDADTDDGWRSPFAASENRNFSPPSQAAVTTRVALTVRGERGSQPVLVVLDDDVRGVALAVRG